jgi:hypothetical protein
MTNADRLAAFGGRGAGGRRVDAPDGQPLGDEPKVLLPTLGAVERAGVDVAAVDADDAEVPGAVVAVPGEVWWSQ